MEENKLTDKEIVTALECCYDTNIICSKKCPLQGIDNCSAIMGKLVLDLICRLQNENERLTNKNYELKGDYVKGYEAGVDEGWDNAVKEIAEEICLKIIKGQSKPIKEKWVEWFKKEYSIEVE